MNKFITSVVCVFFGLVIIVGACGKIDVTNLDEADFDGTQSGDVSFETQILPTLSSSCGTSGCHSGDSPAGGLLLTGTAHEVHESIVKNNVIKINDEANSKLLLAPLQGEMTEHTTKIFDDTSDTTYQLWLTWIQQGAAEN